MTGLRRALVAAVLTTLTVLAGGALVEPAAWAAQEHKLSLSHEQVTTMRERAAQGDSICNGLFMAAGVGAGLATGGASKVVGAGVGLAVDAIGLGCGSNDPQLRDAVDRAHFRGCGMDVYITDGPRSYDGSWRYVVCP